MIPYSAIIIIAAVALSTANRSTAGLKSEPPSDHSSRLVLKSGASVGKVKKLLKEAEGFFGTGRYDLAVKRYKQVLEIDPDNNAAHKGLEQIIAERDRAQGRTREFRNAPVTRLDAWSREFRKR